MNNNMPLNNNGKITIGQSYPSMDGKQLRIVLAIHEDHLLLEMRDAECGSLSQYCVAYLPSFYEGILVWQHGHYFIAREIFGHDPFQALCDAVECMRGPKTVFLLICDTTEGASASVHHTYAEATAALGQSLKNNDDLLPIAETLGLPCTAEVYLASKTDFDDHGASDFYRIEEVMM